jgi:chromosomal replication initiator protein
MPNDQPLDWNALLASVRADYPDLYCRWFESIEPGRLEGGELQVRVGDPARAHYLRERCTQAFTQTAISLTGCLVSVIFIGPETASDFGIGAGPAQGLTEIPLNPDYTFPEFVVGPSNRLAHAACRAICAQPGGLYNPLFIHGASGLGKTHLLQAACSGAARSNPGLHVVYVSCETFVNDFVRAIETGELQPFRDSARKSDMLVVDDIQFLASRESSQEELFHTFNVLYQSRRQIVLSADSPPSEIPTLEDRLISRFSWGLVAQIDQPDRETRQAILQKKARLRGCEIPAEVLDYIAERVESNIRALEGALTKLMMASQLNNRPIDLEMARAVLPPAKGLDQHPLQVSDILQIVSKHFGIRLQELLGRKRTRSVNFPRQVAMYLARRLTPLSLEEIGMHFDGRDHSTILHAERTISSEQEQNPQTAEILSLLTRQLVGRAP